MIARPVLSVRDSLDAGKGRFRPPSESDPMSDFPGVVPALQSALTKRGYDTLTQVQQAVLGSELADADLLVSAQTGSGKTVAFGLAIAPTLLEGEDRLPFASAPLALAIAPTRELAMQVKGELEWLYRETGAVIASCVGGMDPRAERKTLNRGAHIVVGTPGRLRDHIERNALDLSGIRATILDEADEMLDLGFREDLEFILGEAPTERRSLMFSRRNFSVMRCGCRRCPRNLSTSISSTARCTSPRMTATMPSSTCCVTMSPRTRWCSAARAQWSIT
jgi:ATP-dependent RNA helicase DeaD